MTTPKHTPCIELGTHVSDHENCTSTLIDFSGTPFELASNRAKVTPEYHSQMVRDVIHAVNLHDDLVKALESVLEYGLDYSPENQKDIEDHKSLEESLKSLLHRAKEGQ